MAQIESVSLKFIPDIINVGDDISDITVETQIAFHALDIKMGMEYLLHIFVVDNHGKPDIPVFVSNWNNTEIFGMPQDGKDDFIGKIIVPIKANNKLENFETSITLKLGDLKGSHSYYKRKLKVLATLIPAIGIASQWSEPFETKLVF
tara:strand:+ start:686 stop:1129 length:444 start_codon:yes stop_codon:yes gene_type:complete